MKSEDIYFRENNYKNIENMRKLKRKARFCQQLLNVMKASVKLYFTKKKDALTNGKNVAKFCTSWKINVSKIQEQSSVKQLEAFFTFFSPQELHWQLMTALRE